MVARPASGTAASRSQAWQGRQWPAASPGLDRSCRAALGQNGLISIQFQRSQASGCRAERISCCRRLRITAAAMEPTRPEGHGHTELARALHRVTCLVEGSGGSRWQQHRRPGPGSWCGAAVKAGPPDMHTPRRALRLWLDRGQGEGEAFNHCADAIHRGGDAGADTPLLHPASACAACAAHASQSTAPGSS